MGITGEKVTVTTNASCIFGPDDDGCHVHIKGGDDSVYLGAMGVTVEDGYKHDEDEILELNLGPNECIFAICEADTVDIYIFATLNE